MKQVIQVLMVCLLCVGTSTVWAAPVGFQAELNADINVKKTGWTALNNWRTSGGDALFQQGTAFDPTKGEFTVPADGYYLLAANVRLLNAKDGPHGHHIRALIVYDGKADVNRGLNALEGNPRLTGFTLHLEGIVYLKKNTKVALWIYSDQDNDYIIGAATGLSSLFLGSQITHGFHASLVNDTAITKTGWMQFKAGWRTSGSTGLYQAGTGFNATTGEFIAPVDGIYYFNAQPRFHGTGAGIFRIQLAINNRDPENGLVTTGRNTNVPYHSISVSGIVSLKKGDKVTLWIYSEQDNSYALNLQSSFTGALLSTPVNAGFHADLAATSKPLNFGTFISNSYWLQFVNNWRTSGAYGLYTVGQDFDATKGIYTAPQTGLYYVTLQLHTNGITQQTTYVFFTEVWVCVVLNGKRLTRSGLQHFLSRPVQPQISMAMSGLLYLNKGDTLRVDLRSLDASYTVETTSGWSVRFLSYSDVDNDGVDSKTDCNDSDKTIYPGATEICNKLDNDCNGKVDDVAKVCQVAGQKGPCQQSTWSCDASLKKVCLQTVLSQIEVCNSKDDNCDGVVDNISDLGQPCQEPTKQGVCGEGKWQCVSNKKTCVSTSQASAEVCDGKDNDCDGKIDNLKDIGQACTDNTRQGECMAGTWLCSGNQKVCQPLQVPSLETCDGKDEDCDGKVDNIPQAGQPCKDLSQKGECQAGTWVCQGKAKLCKPTNQPATETCDGKDNDCDGKIDNIAELGKACTDNQRKGECQAGVWACVNNAKICQASAQPTAEVCDGKDNDCDGQVDNGGVCAGEKPVTPPDAGTPPETPPAGCGQGCAPGEICRNNTCQKHPCDGVTCQAGEFCRDGQCLPSCGCIACGPGNRCIDGVCRGDICGGVACAKGQACSPSTGQCVADPCQGVTCQANEVCEAGTCVQDPCWLVKCGANQVCSHGQCYDNGCQPGGTGPTPDGGATLPDGPPPIPGAACHIQAHSMPPIFAFLLLLLVAFGMSFRVFHRR